MDLSLVRHSEVPKHETETDMELTQQQQKFSAFSRNFSKFNRKISTYILVSEEIFIKNHIWKMSELTDAHARALGGKTMFPAFFSKHKISI